MNRGVLALTALVCVALPGAARADDYPTIAENTPPSSGTSQLYAGVALGTIGALLFASAPICKTAVVNTPEQNACFTSSFLAGAPFLALSVPLLVYGTIQHGKYADWSKRHPEVGGLSVAPDRRGAAIAWTMTL